MSVQGKDNSDAKLKRFQSLKAMGIEAVRSQLKRESAAFIKIFQDGIKSRSFGLQKLADSTKRAKQRKGYPQPATPLYGKGISEERAFINALRIQKLKNGWKVRISTMKHHESKLTVRQLLILHENGYSFKAGKGSNKKVVNVPPRPAYKKAKAIFDTKIPSLRLKHNKEIREATNKILRTGNPDGFNRIINMATKEAKKFERND